MFCFDNVLIPFASPLVKIIVQIITKITTVLMPVARFELIFATPNFPNIAVSEANKADSIA
jgi:hypothetical protein